jgi:hypothetical protein
VTGTRFDTQPYRSWFAGRLRNADALGRQPHSSLFDVNDAERIRGPAARMTKSASSSFLSSMPETYILQLNARAFPCFISSWGRRMSAASLTGQKLQNGKQKVSGS